MARFWRARVTTAEPDPDAHAVNRTRRQEIVRLLTVDEWVLDDLRHELAITVKTLEEDLRHIQRSVRTLGKRLRVRSAVCADCGFKLKSKALHPPGRCPKCRSQHLEGPWVTIE